MNWFLSSDGITRVYIAYQIPRNVLCPSDVDIIQITALLRFLYKIKKCMLYYYPYI